MARIHESDKEGSHVHGHGQGMPPSVTYPLGKPSKKSTEVWISTKWWGGSPLDPIKSKPIF